jgi:multidrug resistance efflux pump
MKSSSLDPIPSPPDHVWRQIRFNVLPVLMFGLVLVVASWLWGRNLVNPLMVGTAEAPQTDVSSPRAGWLSHLNVKLYQDVQAGDIIAVVDALDPAVLSNTVALVRAEMELLRADRGFDAGDRVRYEQFHLEVLLHRADLIVPRAQAQWASNELERVTQLAKDHVLDPSSVDVARRDLEQVQGSFADKSAALATAEAALAKLDPTPGAPESPSLRAALAVAEQKLHLAEVQLQPILVKAPISGRVYAVKKLPGTAITSGEPLVSITSLTVGRIIAYLAQPIGVEAQVGMVAEIRTRGPHRVLGRGRVVNVGPRIELFDAPLRVRGVGAAQERGLPIEVSVPAGLPLRHGELVDISLLAPPPSGS